MRLKINLEKKISLFLIIILCQQLFILNLVDNKAAFQPISNEFSMNNPVAPYYSYSNIHLNDSLVYLLDGLSIEVMDVSELNDIRKIKTIEYDYYSYRGFSSDYTIYDWENNEFVFYDYNPFRETFNITTLQYNETHYTGAKYYSYNISQNKTGLFNQKLFRENNLLYIFLIYEEHSYFIEDISLEIKLLTFDITNRTNPIMLNSPISFYNSTGLEEWEETDRLISTRNRFSFYDNHLYLVRAYESHEDNGYFSSSELEFSFGFMKTWDISNHSEPIEEFTLEVDQWQFSTIIIHENLLFYKISNYGFIMYDCADMRDIQYLSTYKNDYTPNQIIVSGDLLYLISTGKIQILDIKNPEKIKKIGEYNPRFQGDGSFIEAILEEKILYVSRASEYEDRCFFIIDCNNPTNPKKLFPLGSQLSEDALWKLEVYVLMGIPVIIALAGVTIIIRILRKKREVGKIGV
ncbi:MAG: hypothetical protein GNW80_07915 [Asgard group archaeon]|nr:hypothetical protein [Asgard group archaeon]